VGAVLPLEDAVPPVIFGVNDEAGYVDPIARGAIEALTLRSNALNSREGLSMIFRVRRIIISSLTLR